MQLRCRPGAGVFDQEKLHGRIDTEPGGEVPYNSHTIALNTRRVEKPMRS